jgi:hypothetical protein
MYLTAFDLTQDSGVVDQYGAKKMLQIFNMNPTTEDVAKRYLEHNKNGMSIFFMKLVCIKMFCTINAKKKKHNLLNKKRMYSKSLLKNTDCFMLI